MVTLKYQERFRTEKGVFDEFTKRNLFDLSNKGYFDELISPIFVGKESNVFLASKGDKKVIVKIYRIQNCDFNSMYDYIKRDSRYEKLKKNRRQIIFAWTQREYKNLLKANLYGVKTPKVYAVKNNVLVEELIGNIVPAPQLKDAVPENPIEFFDLIIKDLKLLYSIGLVHGDLSAFNILNDEGIPILIDFSQSTTTKSGGARELLQRDLKNLCKFFGKFGVKANEVKLFDEIINTKEYGIREKIDNVDNLDVK